MDRKRLAVVIVNYKTPEFSLGALDSLLPQVDPELDEVLLVDNDSQDESVSTLEAGLRERGLPTSFRVVAASENQGFSAGVNVGLSAADAEYYLVLNSDVIVGEGAIAAILECAKSARRFGVIGPRLEGLDGEQQLSTFRYPSARGELVEAAGTGPITRLLMPTHSERARSLEEGGLWISFAAVLLSRQIIEQIGLMDEGFFMFFEDVDYCRRAREAGFTLVFCPEARITHLRGGSSPVKRLRSERKQLPAYYYDSRSRYFTKHHGRGFLLFANCLWTLGQIIAWSRELIGRPRHNARRAAIDIWRGATRSLRSTQS